VAERAVGISLADGRFMKIIDRESKLPITRRVMIPTVRDNQRMLEVDVFQGDGEDVIEAEYLGSVVFRELAEARAGEGKLVVDMTLDAERVLRISSPEPGREGETFELSTRMGPEHRPLFALARSPGAARGGA
jgi:molecular chaperone DnaK (HSP70)